ncbi:MAG TPA: hypothetical protein DIV39_10720 [Verrucomicrobiales bacterium]|nr:hypothetical protein [Verrucomicrobiales bacterium]
MLLEKTPDPKSDQKCEGAQGYDHDDAASAGVLSLRRVGFLGPLIGRNRVLKRGIWLGGSLGHGIGLKLIGASWELLLEVKGV